MALRAARNAGVAVPKSTIDRSVAYVKACQNPDGGFRYMRPEDPPASGFARTGAGLVRCSTLDSTRATKSPEGWNISSASVRDGRLGTSPTFSTAITTRLRRCGTPAATIGGGGIRLFAISSSPGSRDGSWMDAVGPEYGTAMACIVLATPNNYLPILQR